MWTRVRVEGARSSFGTRRGGAMPPIYGLVSDAIGSKSLAFIVPLVCYSFVA
jgi:fucose permease